LSLTLTSHHQLATWVQASVPYPARAIRTSLGETCMRSKGEAKTQCLQLPPRMRVRGRLPHQNANETCCCAARSHLHVCLEQELAPQPEPGGYRSRPTARKTGTAPEQGAPLIRARGGGAVRYLMQQKASGRKQQLLQRRAISKITPRDRIGHVL